jgi:RNA polymerase sigma-70 factor (ECF subfamily)
VLGWAIQAARHRAIDLARRRRMYSLPEEVLDLLGARWTDLESEAWSDQMEALHRCVARLAGPARELLQMKYSAGLPAAVIAGELRRTRDAVYQSLSRIHRSLRECVGRELIRSNNGARWGMP